MLNILKNDSDSPFINNIDNFTAYFFCILHGSISTAFFVVDIADNKLRSVNHSSVSDSDSIFEIGDRCLTVYFYVVAVVQKAFFIIPKFRFIYGRTSVRLALSQYRDF